MSLFSMWARLVLGVHYFEELLKLSLGESENHVNLMYKCKDSELKPKPSSLQLFRYLGPRYSPWSTQFFQYSETSWEESRVVGRPRSP